ncbi:MAG: flagellar basal body rod protein FlgC [Nitrospiria bacterium]
MNIEEAMRISATGLGAQKMRLNVIAGNLANVDSTQTTEGGPYRRRDVVFKAAPMEGSFEETLLGNIVNLEAAHQGVKVVQIVLDQRPFKRVYEPQNPSADRDGYVLYPNINPLEEMVNMISALRSYEANVTALNATKSMANKALEIGR